MKKILLFFVLALTLVGCYDYGKCNINYSIVYPDTIITYDTIFRYRYSVGVEYDVHTPTTTSSRGSNYINVGEYYFAGTTCPIRINSYKTIYKSENEE